MKLLSFNSCKVTFFSLLFTTHLIAEDINTKSSITKVANEIITLLEKEKLLLQAAKKKESESEGQDRDLQMIKLTKRINEISIQTNTLKDSLLPLLKEQQYLEAKQLISRTPLSSESPEFHTKWSELKTTIGAAQKTQINQLKSEIDDLDKKIASILFKAKTAPELDQLLVELDRHEKDFNSYNRYGSNHFSGRLSSSREIVSTWQNYLIYHIAGDTNKAISSLSSISRSLVRHPIIPRSYVLQKEQELKQKSNQHSNSSKAPFNIKSITETYRSSSELETILAKCKELEKYSSTKSDARYLKTSVEGFLQVRKLIETNQAPLALINLNSVNMIREKEWCLSIKRQLKLLALPQLVPQQYRKQLKSSNILEAIPTVANMMRQQKDWHSLWEFFVACRGIFSKSNYGSHAVIEGFPWLNNDIFALEKYIAGSRFEAAGEYYKALQSYSAMLEKTGKYAPYTEAETRIAALKSEHSEELEKASKVASEMKNMRELARQSYMHSRHRTDIRTDIESVVNKAVDEKISLYMKVLESQQRKDKSSTEKE